MTRAQALTVQVATAKALGYTIDRSGEYDRIVCPDGHTLTHGRLNTLSLSDTLVDWDLRRSYGINLPL